MPTERLPAEMWPELDRLLDRVVQLGPNRDEVLRSIQNWVDEKRGQWYG